MPGTSRSVSAKDQVGDGSVSLIPPSEDRFRCSTKVRVWTLQSIKQKSHRAVGSSLQAFRQILQILKRGRSDGQNACPAGQQMARYSCISISVVLVFCEAHLLAHRLCYFPRTTSRILAATLTFHTRQIWTTRSTLLKAHTLCVL